MSESARITQPTAEQSEDDLDRRRVKQPSPLRRWLGASGTWVLLLDLLLIAFFTLVSQDNVFISPDNFKSMMISSTELILLSLGVALFMSAGYIDISVGANLSLSSVLGAMTMLTLLGNSSSGVATGGAHVDFPVAVAAGLAVCVVSGMLFGLVNGVIIAILDVNSLIATLGTSGIGIGIALLLTSGVDLPGLPADLQVQFGLRTIGPIPVATMLALVVALVLSLVMRRTRFGLRTLALGSSSLAAARAGINTQRLTMQLAVITGLFAGLAGFISLTRFGTTVVQGHANDPLNAITAVVIGGTPLMGGRISVAGTIWGVALAIILLTGIVIMQVPSFWQLIVVGGVLITAVAIDRARFKRRQRQ